MCCLVYAVGLRMVLVSCPGILLMQVCTLDFYTCLRGFLWGLFGVLL